MKKALWLAVAAALICIGSTALAQVDAQLYFSADGSLNSDKVQQDIRDGTVDPVELVRALTAEAPHHAAAIVSAALAAAPEHWEAIVAAAKEAAPEHTEAIHGAARQALGDRGTVRTTMHLEGALGDKTDPTTFKALSPSQ